VSPPLASPVAGGAIEVPEVSADRGWSQRLIAGDESALREAYREHGAAVLGLAVRVLGNVTTAEDVMQDVFVRLWEQPERFDPTRGRLRSYLLAMTHSRAAERLRAEASQRRRLDVAGRQPVDPAQSDPTHALAVQDASTAVRRVLAELPEDQRVAIDMAYFGGLSYRDVAVALAEPEGTVRYRIRAGMQKMRAALQAQEISP
jgi:RNA polymerase sigma-70 factor (ECF subfamily)